MPHELSMHNGEAEMFYTGETPWHGLGTKLDGPATYREAIEQAHLDWTVETREVHYLADEAQFGKVWRQADNHRVVVRNDTDQALGMVSDRYQVCQNTEAWEWADNILGQGGAHYHTAGALRDGRVQWILAQRPNIAEIVPGDIVEQYLLMVNSHDGSLPLQIHPTGVRAVCANTVQAALSKSGGSIVSIRHTASLHKRIKDTEKALRMGDEHFNQMVTGAQLLGRTRMSLWEMGEFTQKLLKIDPESPRKTNALTQAAETLLNDLFVGGKGQEIPGVKNTAWAAYNAVTEYVDWYSRVQKLGEERQDGLAARDQRVHRSWFGKGNDIRNTAWRLLHDFQGHGSRVFEYQGERDENLARV